MKNKIINVALAVTAGLATIAVTPVAASATPSKCTVGTFGPPYIPYEAGTVYCTAGTGRYRATATCYNDGGRALKVYGAWVSRSDISTAKCTSNYYSLGAHSYQFE
jgi:hypothetical protein